MSFKFQSTAAEKNAARGRAPIATQGDEADALREAADVKGRVAKQLLGVKGLACSVREGELRQA